MHRSRAARERSTVALRWELIFCLIHCFKRQKIHRLAAAGDAWKEWSQNIRVLSYIDIHMQLGIYHKQLVLP